MAVIVGLWKGRSNRFLQLFLSLLLLAGSTVLFPVMAKEMPQAQKASLLVAIDKFDAAMTKRDFTAVIEASVPPALLQHIIGSAELKGVDIKSFKALIITQMANALKKVKLIEFGMDKKAISIRELADGSFYSLIPTRALMDLNSKHIKTTSQTLGIMDQGRWYLLRVSNPQQVGMVKAVFPQLKTVEFKIGTMEEVK